MVPTGGEMKKQSIREKNRVLLDENLEKVRAINWPATNSGWVKTIRTSLKMTESDLAQRMGLNQTTVNSLEKSEVAGSIQLSTLKRAAEALNCELVYALVPRQKLQKTYYQRALEIAHTELPMVIQTMKLENQLPESSSNLEEWLAQQIIEADRVHW